MVGLSPHLILRTARADGIRDGRDDIGWTGNILFDRMVGSTIYTCTPGEVSTVYATHAAASTVSLPATSFERMRAITVLFATNVFSYTT
jgi:hypothetical protein